MNISGVIRVAAAVPRVNVADCAANAQHIIEHSKALAEKSVRLCVFPELSVTAYTCGDLLHTDSLLNAAFSELHHIAQATVSLPMVVVVVYPSGSRARCRIVRQ